MGDTTEGSAGLLMMGTLVVAEDGLGRCQRQMGVQSKSQTSAQDSCPFISQEIGTGLVDLPQNKDTSSMVIALGFNICICHQKHGKDDNNNVPSREDQPELVSQTRHVGNASKSLRESFCHFTHAFRVVPSGESNHCRDLEETNLKRVC